MASTFLLRRGWISLVFALLVPTGVIALHAALSQAVAVPALLLFLGGVMLVAWVGGIVPGLVACVLSIAFFVAPTAGATSLDLVRGPDDLARDVIFLLEGAVIVFVTSLARETQERLVAGLRRQSALAELSQNVLAAAMPSDLSLLWNRTVALCAQALNAPVVLLLEYDDQSHQFFVRAAHGSERLGADFQVGAAFQERPESLFGQALKSPDPVVVNDVKTPGDTRPTLPTTLEGAVESLICVRVGPPETAWGVLCVGSAPDHRPRHALGADEIAFVEAVAVSLALGLERERARRAWAEGELRYRAFLEQTDEAIWRWEFEQPVPLNRDADAIIADVMRWGFVAECNDALARQYGFQHAQEIVGVRLEQLFDTTNPSNQEYFRALVENGFRLTDAESAERTRDGSPLIVLNNVVGIIEDGALVRLWGTQRDITAQKRAQQELQESENRFRTLFDASPLAITILRDGRTLYANPALARMLKVPDANALIGRSAQEFATPAARALIMQRVANREQGGNEPTSYEVEAIRANGQNFPARVEVAPLQLLDGAATLVFVFDLAPEQRTRAEIETLVRTEQRIANRALGLQEIAFLLARSLSVAEVARIVVGGAVEALGAVEGALFLTQKQHLQRVYQQDRSDGQPNTALSREDQIALNTDVPATRALKTELPLWVSSLTEAAAEFADLGELAREGGSMAALPLVVDGRVVGVLLFRFPEERKFSDDHRAFLVTLALQCAGAIERARLDVETQDLARRQREALALLDTLLDSAPIGFALFDKAGRFVLVNDALAHLTGLSSDDYLGREPHELPLAPALVELVETAVARVWEQRQPSGELAFSTAGAPANPAETVTAVPRSDLFGAASFYPVSVAAPGEDDTGELLGVGAVFIDLTERVRSERERNVLVEQLAIERARFEAILQQMPSAVVIAEAPSGRIISTNSQFEQILGYETRPAEDVSEYRVYKGFHPDGRPLEPQEWPLARTVTHGEVIVGEEIVVRRGDDHLAIIRANGAPIRDRDGEIAAGVVIFDDVTQRARADAAQRFLAEVSSILVARLNEHLIYEKLAQTCVPRVADWCIVAVPESDDKSPNPHLSVPLAEPLTTTVALRHHTAVAFAPAQTHLEAEDAGYKSLAERIQMVLQSDPGLSANIRNLLQGGRATLYDATSLTEFRSRASADIYARFVEQLGVRSAMVAPLEARGRTLGVVLWLSATSGRDYDFTDLALAEEVARRAALAADNARLLREAEIARDEAQTANRAKDEFLAVVSHELRTPLTPILGWLDLLRSAGIDNTMRERAYDVIERNARAQAQLVGDILDVSRITTGKLRLDLSAQPLASLVERAIDGQRPAAREKNIVIKENIEEVGESFVDTGRMQQVVWNLLQNAIKFTPENGQILVSLRAFESDQGRRALLEVTDSGVGIRSDFLPHVFDSFRQADSSSTRRAGGLGLGLAIVKHIVDRLGGTVSADSPGEGQGATFSVELPLVALEPKPADDAILEGGVKRIGGELAGVRALVVDDEADTRELLAHLLSRHGANVRVASNGRAALDLMGEFGPDVVVSDIGMPEMDGFELRRYLSERWQNVPVVALTAYAAPGDEEQALAAGFNRYLAKPVTAEALLKAVRELVPSAES